jgi:hypothetical protein
MLIVLLSSCAQNNYKNSLMPGINIPAENMNSIIKLTNPDSLLNSYKNEQRLSLYITNTSDQTIIFSGDFGVKVFAWIKGNWVTISNEMEYPDTAAYLLPEDVFPPGMVFSVIPRIENMNTKTHLRVVIVGKSSNDPSQKYGSFIDLLISP